MFNSGFKIRLIIGLIFALFSIVKYYSSSSVNEVTGENQHISISPDQEIQLGLQSAPQMAQQYGGLYPDEKVQNLVKSIGNKVVQKSDAARTPYHYDFHLLADPETLNAFALPGGQIFMTYGLLKRLSNEDQIAGVLGHEIGHVVARHSAEQVAKEGLTSGLTGAAVMASGDYNSSQYAQMIGNMVNMKYGRADELEADALGVKFMVEAGLNPDELIGVMKVLEDASGGSAPPEFQSTHPSPANRIQKIKEEIAKYKR